MVALSEVAYVVVTVYSGLSHTAYYLLAVSYLIGQALVLYMRQLASYFLKIMSQFATCLQIVFEDYFVFMEDLFEWTTTLVTFFRNLVLFFFTNTVATIGNIKSLVLKMIDIIFATVYSIYSFLVYLCSTLSEIIIVLKQSFIILGSSICLGLTLIPVGIVYMINLVYIYFVILFEEIKSIYLHFLNICLHTINNVILFFIDIPVDSVVGCCVGVMLMYLFLKNFKKIIIFLTQQCIKFYNHIELISNYLWTGEFLDNISVGTNQPETVNNVTVPQMQHQSGNSEKQFEKENVLCIVCQDRLKDVIILPCCHVCLCEECSYKIRRLHGFCPICRTTVKRTMKVYI